MVRDCVRGSKRLLLLCVRLFAVSAATYPCNHEKSLFSSLFDCKFISLYDNVANLFLLLLPLGGGDIFFE